MTKTILDIPYAHKELGKELGARWDGAIKKWYFLAKDGESLPEGLKKWKPKAVKEGAFLYVDLIPATAWFANLRSEIKASEWNKIRKIIFERDNNLCVICGGIGHRHPVEAHERWSYDDDNKIQTLTRIESLCPRCHEVTHIGLASVRGRMESAMEHLKTVNNWSTEQAEDHIQTKADEWEDRSQVNWTMNLTYILENFEEILSPASKKRLKSIEKKEG